mgnify:CR=1 FL=1
MSNEFSINILRGKIDNYFFQLRVINLLIKDHGQNSDKGIKAGAAPVSFNEVEKVDRREIYDPKV